MIIFVAVVSYYGIYLLLLCKKRIQETKLVTTFGEIGEFCFGRKGTASIKTSLLSQVKF
jgi:amino acid permease